MTKYLIGDQYPWSPNNLGITEYKKGVVSAMGLKHSALRFLERTADFSEVEKFEGKGLGCMPETDYKVQVNTKRGGRCCV